MVASLRREEQGCDEPQHREPHGRLEGDLHCRPDPIPVARAIEAEPNDSGVVIRVFHGTLSLPRIISHII